MKTIKLPDTFPPHYSDRQAPGSGYGDATNGELAQWGSERADDLGLSDMLEDRHFADVINQLLHFTHSKGLDPLEIIRSAVTDFLAEAGDEI